MLKSFQPTWQIRSITKITPSQWKKEGIQTILTDLDNTLVSWKEPLPTQELKDWIHYLQSEGIQIIIISNNNKERVQLVAQELGVDYISRALKPLPTGILKAIHRYHLNKEEVVMVGDQLMTDIQAAHLAGVRSILVQPLVNTDSKATKFNRLMENKVKQKLQAANLWHWEDQL